MPHVPRGKTAPRSTTSFASRIQAYISADRRGRGAAPAESVEAPLFTLELKPMNPQVPEQVVAAQKVGVEALYGFLNTGFEAYEKLVALNLQAAKASILENEAVASEAFALSARDPQSFFELQSRQSQAATRKAQAYWQHVNEVATETRSQLLASAEKLASGYIRETQVIIDNLARNPPAHNEMVTAFWSKGFGAMWDAGNALHEQTRAAAKEAVDVIDKAGKRVAKA
jgi:phasin family protein